MRNNVILKQLFLALFLGVLLLSSWTFALQTVPAPRLFTDFHSTSYTNQEIGMTSDFSQSYDDKSDSTDLKFWFTLMTPTEALLNVDFSFDGFKQPLSSSLGSSALSFKKMQAGFDITKAIFNDAITIGDSAPHTQVTFRLYTLFHSIDGGFSQGFFWGTYIGAGASFSLPTFVYSDQSKGFIFYTKLNGIPVQVLSKNEERFFLTLGISRAVSNYRTTFKPDVNFTIRQDDNNSLNAGVILYTEKGILHHFSFYHNADNGLEVWGNFTSDIALRIMQRSNKESNSKFSGLNFGARLKYHALQGWMGKTFLTLPF